MSYCEWGLIVKSTPIFRGVRSVICEGHGGVIVTEHAMATLPQLEKLRTFPEIRKFFDGKVYNFEEDCDYAMVYSLLDHQTLNQLFGKELTDDEFQARQGSFISSLLQFNPDFYTHLTGKSVQIFESTSLWNEFIKNNENHFYKHASADSRSWDIPDDKIMLSFREHPTDKIVYCLATREQYDQVLNLDIKARIFSDLSAYEPFTPNKRLPYSKPHDPQADTFYIYTHKSIDNGLCVVEAYNYQTNSYKHFQMTHEAWCAEQPRTLKFKDATHSELIDEQAGVMLEIPIPAEAVA